MQLDNTRDTFIFLCAKIREGKTACNNSGTVEQSVEHLQKTLKNVRSKLKSPRKIKANATGCIGKCKFGPNLVIFPEGVWYNYYNNTDLDEIVHEHIVNGKVVKRLLNRVNKISNNS